MTQELTRIHLSKRTTTVLCSLALLLGLFAFFFLTPYVGPFKSASLWLESHLPTWAAATIVILFSVCVALLWAPIKSQELMLANVATLIVLGCFVAPSFRVLPRIFFAIYMILLLMIIIKDIFSKYIVGGSGTNAPKRTKR